jgi:hypothetical protein
MSQAMNSPKRSSQSNDEPRVGELVYEERHR